MSPARQKTVALVQTQAENAGAQEIARQLARGFEQRGWRTRQIFFFRRTESFDDAENVFFCAQKRPSSVSGILRMIRELFTEFRREKPDAVVMLQHYGNLFAAPIARLAGKSIVIANQLTPDALVPKPVFLVDKLMGSVGFYDHIVVNSAQTEAKYSRFPRPYATRITRIDHGFFDKSTQVDKATARARLALPAQATLLGCAARLHWVKQVDLAIRLLVENPDQHLALAGQGPQRDHLEELALSLGVRDRVHFLGELDTTRMSDFLGAIDCFVFPSAGETFGLAPVEAAQAGIPVIVNDLPVLREVLAVDGKPCAIFVDATDTSAFAAAVRRMLEDPALRQELTGVGRRLTERYPLDAMVEAYLRLMENPSA